MNWFKILSLVIGVAALGKPIYMHLLFDANKAVGAVYGQRRPAWIIPVAAVGLVVVAFTWYQVFVSEVQWGWVLATLLTISGLKAATLLFNYQAFHEFADSMTKAKGGKGILLLNIAVGVLGLAMVAMGIFLY